MGRISRIASLLGSKPNIKRKLDPEAPDISSIDYHRNGSGNCEGFYQISFNDKVKKHRQDIGYDLSGKSTHTNQDTGEGPKTAIVFPANGSVAIVSDDILDYHWRGDHYEHYLRDAIRAHEKNSMADQSKGIPELEKYPPTSDFHINTMDKCTHCDQGQKAPYDNPEKESDCPKCHGTWVINPPQQYYE